MFLAKMRKFNVQTRQNAGYFILGLLILFMYLILISSREQIGHTDQIL